MNIFRRYTAATLPFLLAALAGGAAPAPADPPRAHPAIPAPTVEPTLPLLIDLAIEGVEKRPGGHEARLVLDLRPLADLKNLVIRPILPSSLIAGDADAIPEHLATIARGPARRFVLPLFATGDGRREIRVEVEFDDEQGRHLRLGQGVTFDPDPTPVGRLQLGAYEVMAVPIEKVGH
jgi:hypothetical protein